MCLKIASNKMYEKSVTDVSVSKYVESNDLGKISNKMFYLD